VITIWQSTNATDLRCVARPRRAGVRRGSRGQLLVRFTITRVPAQAEKPHGLDYSLTLHGPKGERLVGFDNAHPVGKRKRGEPQDHQHRLRRVRPYDYRDAATLLADFWTAVDAALRERGVIR
jgi:hypothetical protein